uniref:Mut7-C RNAse domain-containing protein n=2 Tax=Craspedostauros australis TaxID=1486917 RepID=A0A7S0F706_9STRA
MFLFTYVLFYHLTSCYNVQPTAMSRTIQLCQAHYILTRAQAFCGDQTPLIVCGDFNSNPGSNVHRYMVEGSVNAKMLAPWHNVAVPKEDITTVDPTATQADTNGSEAASLSMEETMNGLSMATDSSDTNAHGNGSASHSNTDKDVTDEIVKHGSNIRYLLDFTLNRLCRWLRILGIDAALETEAEEKLRTKQQKMYVPQSSIGFECWCDGRIHGVGYICTSGLAPWLECDAPGLKDAMRLLTTILFHRVISCTLPIHYIANIPIHMSMSLPRPRYCNGNHSEIFRRCHAEKRTLITTSSRLLARKDCPPGTYLLTTKSLSHLELAFPHILSSHGVKLFPRQFLSRCVVCNGHIRGVSDDQVQEIFSQHHAPIDQTLEKLDVFQCSGCGQGYWWCDQPTSSASRVKNQATKLLEYCIQGNVEIDEDMGMFDYVDVEALQNSNQTDDGDGPSRIAGPPLEVVRWLRQDALANPLGQLKSVYIKSDDPTKEVLQFTNLTSRFAGVLDYVMYLPGQLELQERLYVPLEKEDLNCQGIHNGHLLPSFVWPSDHLALGARFSFVNDNDGEQGDSEAQDEKNDSKESSAVTIEPQLDTESSAMVQILKQAVKTDDFLFCAPVGGEITVPPPVTTIPKLFKQPLASSGQNKDDHDDHPETEDHGDKCACGCVPDVLSLFEMAKLRKEARERRKARAEGAAGIA